jgi:hypothetical protein
VKGIKHNARVYFASGRLALCRAIPPIGLLALLQSGCAIHYHDARTGTEHVWGLAHVKMRVAPTAAPDDDIGAPRLPNSSSAAPAMATQVETVGLGFHLGNGSPDANSGLSLGWDRRTRLLVPDDTALSLEWPTSRLFDVRIGSAPAFPGSTVAPTDSVSISP